MIFVVSIGIVFATGMLFLGLLAAMDIAISIAAKLEPQPGHQDQFDALRRKLFFPALLIAVGLGFLAWLIALASL